MKPKINFPWVWTRFDFRNDTADMSSSEACENPIGRPSSWNPFTSHRHGGVQMNTKIVNEMHKVVFLVNPKIVLKVSRQQSQFVHSQNFRAMLAPQIQIT